MLKENRRKKIILSGGGTGGSVTPILAVARDLIKQKKNIDFVFVGTENGPERELVASFSYLKIPFISLPAGKLRRYFSIQNFFDFFKIVSAFFKSFSLLRREKPDLIISAGSFASVPLVYASVFFKTPILIHQQDIRPGLANKLMAPLARIVTVVFEKSLVDYGPKAALTGNPIVLPDSFIWPENVPLSFFEKDKALILCLGGGTGATALNEIVFSAKDYLKHDYNIVHLTGRGKLIKSDVKNENYLALEFLEHEKVLSLMEKADLIVSRCGLGVLTELAALAKPSILIPMPKSHQNDNALLFEKSKAAIVFNQKDLNGEILADKIKEALNDKKLLEDLSHNISKIMKKEASNRIAGIVWETIKNDYEE